MTFADRCRETTETTGTGTLSLAGAVSKYQTLVAGVGTASVIPYCVAHRSAAEWEVGFGTVTSGSPDTLSRSKILASSNAGSAVNFSAGTKDVFLTHPAIVVDGGARLRSPCRVATTGNVTIAAALVTGQTIDGTVLAAGDRVLVWNQTTPSENGIYVAGATPARAGDFWTGTGASGAMVFVTSGTALSGLLLICTAASGSDVIGTSSLAFLPMLRGPATATDNAVARFDGSSGGKLQNSGVLIDDADKVLGKASYSLGSEPTDGATVTLDLDADNVFVPAAMAGNRTLAVTNADVRQRFMLLLTQDGTGSRTVTWWSNITWPGGVIPTLSTTAGAIDVFGFLVTGTDGYGAPTFLGFTLGQDYQP